ncbi:polymerase [Mesorhizobium sp. M1E.F.Ca.ET.045.02.1.1]|uniref:O-antigen ligase family protein n=1 Tax=unclassified Mesorhizobium TaxID=325217 RepID=UPI000F75DB32|nr:MULTISPECIES: polymerase [unclassified Mesorhizobium]AZO21420.1 polymerase [Mesorhizobium sp. M1E.F.Ca.ET.045.02.1.1]RUW84286.1 polymerase [Mesorhizobium sp. M1E.F.Ca.ET.063.01.1.1]
MIRDALLAFGVVMAGATQLNIPGSSFGYGELSLTLWIMLSIGRILAGGRIEFTPALTSLAGFWLVMAVTLAIGTIVAYLTTVIFLTGLIHDTVAYLLLVSITCLAAAEPDADRHFRRSTWWLLAIANTALAIQVIQGWGWIPQAGVESWYWDRFRGWSENPNQLALYCAIFGTLALHLATTTGNRWGRFVGIASVFFTFYVGRLTKSDAFLYTSILTYLTFLGLQIRTWLKTAGAKVSLPRQALVLLLIGSVPLAMSVTPYVLSEATILESFAKSLTKDKGGEATAETAELRLYLWNAALEKGAQSGSLGLGPGAHVGRPPTWDRQFDALTRPFEAHSTILDLYTQGGIISVLALVWIVGAAIMSAWRAKLDALLALMVSIVIFSMPHLIIRHPIVWFAITFCLVAGTPRAFRQRLISIEAM